MAATVLNAVNITEKNKFVDDVTFQAVHATDGAVFTMEEQDERYVFAIKNADGAVAKTVTIKAGNSVQSEFGDLAKELAAGDIVWVSLDSGRFKNVYGTNKGKVLFSGTDAKIEIAVIRLP